MDKQTAPTAKKDRDEVGYASSINDYLVWINGLPNVKISEIVTTAEGARGIVTAIRDDKVEVLMLEETQVTPQQLFKRTFQQLSINVGPHLIGRTINALGVPIDGKPRFTNTGEPAEIEKEPLGIKAREQITRQFETGITLVDMLVPVSYGQRELVIGDSRSGKTAFMIDLIINQRHKNLVCVYAAVGKTILEIKRLVEVLEVNRSLEYTVVLAASSSEIAPLIFLTPSVAVSVAEYFQQQGKDVLLILDDLGQHAKFYREISLLSGTAPGRESYPGDIFFQHARLVERAGNFNKTYKGGSITCFPVIETNLDDFSGFMPTNLMGMTDGHLLFNSGRYHQGHRPSIDVALSVSRVGRQTQYLAQKQLADRVKALLADAARLESFSRLGSDVSSKTMFTIKQGKQVEALLSQPALVGIPIAVQMILIGLIFTPFFGQKDLDFVERNKSNIISFLTTHLDLEPINRQIASFKTDKQFIDSLASVIPSLEKICK